MPGKHGASNRRDRAIRHSRPPGVFRLRHAGLEPPREIRHGGRPRRLAAVPTASA